LPGTAGVAAVARVAGVAAELTDCLSARPFLRASAALLCSLLCSLFRCSARSCPVARLVALGLFQLAVPWLLGEGLPAGAPPPLL